MNTRICITGIGAACHRAFGIDALWQRLLDRVAGLKQDAPFPVDHFRCKWNTICDPVDARRKLTARNPEMAELLPEEAPAGLVYGLIAAVEAIELAGLGQDSQRRFGLVLGTTSGGLFDRFSAGETVDPTLSAPHSILSILARILRLSGPVAQISNACTSSAAAITHAAGMIIQGRAEIVLCGGADHARAADFAGFNALRAMSSTSCKPFDVDRDGMIIGDGAAILVLESEASALHRGANILAVLDGFGLSSDAFHSTRPRPEGLARAVRSALKMAGKGLDDIGYVNCHGTGTPHNDKTEIAALGHVFSGIDRPVISSTKSTTGHLLGSAAALEAVIVILALSKGLVPQMAHTRHTDPEIGFDFPVGSHRHLKGQRALSTTLGFGGSNACLAFACYDQEVDHA